MTLNTFHSTGRENTQVTLGVPRLKELIDATKTIKTASMTVYAAPALSGRREAVEKVAASLRETHLDHLALACQCVCEPDPRHTRVEADQAFVNLFWRFPPPRDHAPSMPDAARWVVRYTLDPALCSRARVTVFDVSLRLRALVGKYAYVESTPANMSPWVVRVRLRNVRQFYARVRDGPANDFSSGSDEELCRFLKASVLSSLRLWGVPGVSATSVRKEQKHVVVGGAGLRLVDEYVIKTVGSNLLDTLALDGVDATRTTTNDIHETIRMFGVEAAARRLAQEMSFILSFDGNAINSRHITTLVRTMTRGGTYNPVTRDGLKKQVRSTMKKASFEETRHVFAEAAAHGYKDNVTGVTERIMLGLLPPIGTGTVAVVQPAKRAAHGENRAAPKK